MPVRHLSYLLADMHSLPSRLVSLLLLSTPLVSLAHSVPAHLTKPLTKHSWVQIPRGWEEHSVPPADHPITLKIALKQDGIDELVKTLYEVSDPGHEKYGIHLSRV